MKSYATNIDSIGCKHEIFQRIDGGDLRGAFPHIYPQLNAPYQ